MLGASLISVIDKKHKLLNTQRCNNHTVTIRRVLKIFQNFVLRKTMWLKASVSETEDMFATTAKTHLHLCSGWLVVSDEEHARHQTVQPTKSTRTNMTRGALARQYEQKMASRAPSMRRRSPFARTMDCNGDGRAVTCNSTFGEYVLSDKKIWNHQKEKQKRRKFLCRDL